jgi:hypothetical protein
MTVLVPRIPGGVRAVIRDDRGKFIAACNDPIHHAIDANILDAWAISKGITLGNEIGCVKVIIYLVCLQVLTFLIRLFPFDRNGCSL